MNNNVEKHTKFYSVSDFSKRISVSTCTLRNWDNSDLLKPHHKTPGNHRVYSEEQALEYLDANSSDRKYISVITKCGVIFDVDNLNIFTDYELKSICAIIEKHIALCKK